MNFNALAAVALLGACATGLTEHEDVRITGRVVSATSGDGVGNVTIASDQLSVYSDFDGAFSLEGRMLEPATVQLTLQKTGYASLVTDVVVEAADTDVGTLAIAPLNP